MLFTLKQSAIDYLLNFNLSEFNTGTKPYRAFDFSSFDRFFV